MWNVKKPHFLVGFDPSSCSERLKIPSKFVKSMEGRITGTTLLIGPSGNIWRADLIQQNEELFFDDGWAAFVRDNFVEDGDSLVFRYDDDLHFSVQVFDQSSCEKEAAFNAECTQDPGNCSYHLVKKRDRESSSLLDSIIEGVPKKMRSAQVHAECATENQDRADKEGCLREDLVSSRERSQAPSFSHEMDNGVSTLRNSVTIAVPSQGNILGENSEATTSNRSIMEDVLLTASEAERAARSFISSFPNFVKVMKRFNISGSYTLNVPYQFAMAHLPKCKVKIVLRNIKGQSWTVNSIPTTRVQTSHTFCGGWLGFVRDNNIDMGDICIFELVRKCELRVQILRVQKEGVDDRSGKVVHKGIVNSSAATSHKISGRKSKKVRGNSHKMYLQRITKVDLSDKKGCDPENMKRGGVLAAICSQIMSSGGESAIIKNTGYQVKGASVARGCMSMKSAPEEKLAAQSFISSFPHFVRVMKKFNISGSYTLKIPFQFSMEHLPNCRTEILLRNLKGECWTVNSIPTTKVQTLHTFCGGWMAFVRDNDIQMGDICIFELIGKCEMRVHISGIGKKGLDYQGGKGASNGLAVSSLTNNRSMA